MKFYQTDKVGAGHAFHLAPGTLEQKPEGVSAGPGPRSIKGIIYAIAYLTPTMTYLTLIPFYKPGDLRNLRQRNYGAASFTPDKPNERKIRRLHLRSGLKYVKYFFKSSISVV